MGKRTKHSAAASDQTAQHAEEVEQSLTAIFQDEKGDMPDLSKLEQHRRSGWLWLALGGGFVLMLLLAAWTGFVLFKPFAGSAGKGLDVSADGPEQVALGQETTYFINWKNDASEPLANADIRVSFPADFTPTLVDPKPTGPGLLWRLGPVAFGGHGAIVVRGIFAGALGTQTVIQAVGTYRFTSSNGDEEALATRRLDYADTVLAGALDVAKKSLPGDKLRFVYRFENRGTSAIQNLEARVTLPDGFVVDASSSGALPDGRVVRFPVGTLSSGASSSVAVAGSFASGASGNLPIHAELGHVALDGSFQPALKTDANIGVEAGDLLLKLVVNGSDVDRSIGFDEPLRISIGYENTATEDLKGVSLRLVFEPVGATTTSAGTPSKKRPPAPPVVDWLNLDGSSTGTRVEDTVIWSAPEISALARLLPQQDGTIDVSVPTAHATTTSPAAFQVVAEASVATVGDTALTRTIRTAPIVFRFRSDADLASEARYYSEEGAPLGTGPLPPVVGKPTTYRIQWTLAKTVHELKDIRVSAAVPKQVAWPAKGTVGAGDLFYDQTTHTVSWTLNRMPENVDEVNADFDLQLTPSEFDAGRFADLLGETTFTATDVQLNEQLRELKPALTTDLQNDEGAKSKGVVRKP